MNRLTQWDKESEISFPTIFDDLGDWKSTISKVGDVEEMNIQLVINELAEYEDLIEQKRIIKLPCAIGTVVYKQITQHSNYDDTPYKIISAVNFRLNMIYDIGKTVFLTKEEAEEKLKRRINYDR